ncbi:unnamed protein product, partial [Ixodes persulcatus]
QARGVCLPPISATSWPKWSLAPMPASRARWCFLDPVTCCLSRSLHPTKPFSALRSTSIPSRWPTLATCCLTYRCTNFIMQPDWQNMASSKRPCTTARWWRRRWRRTPRACPWGWPRGPTSWPCGSSTTTPTSARGRGSLRSWATPRGCPPLPCCSRRVGMDRPSLDRLGTLATRHRCTKSRSQRRLTTRRTTPVPRVPTGQLTRVTTTRPHKQTTAPTRTRPPTPRTQMRPTPPLTSTPRPSVSSSSNSSSRRHSARRARRPRPTGIWEACPRLGQTMATGVAVRPPACISRP